MAKGAFAFPWTGLRAYVYPPISLIPQVLEKAKRERPNLILIALWWEARPWFPRLRELAEDHNRPVSGSSRHHTAGFRRSSSGSQQTSADRVEAIRHGLNKLQLAPQVIDAILHSRRDSTAKCTVLGGGFG